MAGGGALGQQFGDPVAQVGDRQPRVLQVHLQVLDLLGQAQERRLLPGERGFLSCYYRPQGKESDRR
jgi:hypothetical protein